jgi:hypothetical protein
MSQKDRETVRKMAKQARDWTVELLDLLNTVDGNNT